MKNLAIFLLVLCFVAGTNANIFEDLIAKEYPSRKSFSVSCDITVKKGVCLYGGEKLVLAGAQPDGLVGYWSFDDKLGSDASGEGNNAQSEIRSGPSFGPSGFSAATSATEFITIPHSSSLDNSVYTITFWLYLIGQSTLNTDGLRWCPLLLKGREDDGNVNRGPAIYIDRLQRSLKVYVSTNNTQDHPNGEFFGSNSRIPYSKWTHITVARKDKRSKLYVNGVLDSVHATDGTTEPNTDPLYVGNVPWRQEDCNVPAYFDELKVYSRELQETEIQAEAAIALGNANPSAVQFGCLGCTLSQAQKACLEGYHVCSATEYHSFAFQIASSMGWADSTSNIWSYGALQNLKTTTQTEESSEGSQKAEDIAEETGLAVCCAN